ncbi:hypothetical protein DSO57_1027170 [Entomophthora muscae]|uniref:Uncharacterized protein n=1 Tax=Entomophthora muscae TaxID=34485 RepID=A0ACC2TNX5_9FUNG|nr:hypothetical protein DSO57_1027170 [Entomophthora muscae]
MDLYFFLSPPSGKNHGQIQYLLDNLPGRNHVVLPTEENLVKSLTCDNLDAALIELTSVNFFPEKIPTIDLFEEKGFSTHHNLLFASEYPTSVLPDYSQAWF